MYSLADQMLSVTQTDRQTVCPLCLSWVSIPWVDEARCIRNLKTGEGKNPGTTNKYMKFGQLIIRKISKITATRCHILWLKCTKFDSRCPSVCLFIRLCLRWSLTPTDFHFNDSSELSCSRRQHYKHYYKY